MKTVLIGLVLAMVLVAPMAPVADAVDLEPLRTVYDPCALCAQGFWVHCWACAMVIAWENGEPPGWWA